MHRNLHMLDTSLMQVSGDRVEPDEQMNSRKEPLPWYRQTFYSKRSCDQCTCGTVMSHMMSQHCLMM